MSRKGKLVKSASDKEQYKLYENRFEKNKIRAMEKTLKDQPNNKDLEKSLKLVKSKGAKYTRNRKSDGHICKGLNSSLGFINNSPNEYMTKGKAPIHAYYAINQIVYLNKSPNHGKSIRDQSKNVKTHN